MRGLVASFHARINIGAPQFDIEKINPDVNFSLSLPPTPFYKSGIYTYGIKDFF